jgi:drug/metabolite transporter (DMT)-like permease
MTQSPDLITTIITAERRMRTQALVSMVASCVLFSLMGASTKALTRAVGQAPTLPGAEVACFRYLCGIAAMLAIARFRGANLLGNDRQGLLWRGIYGGFASTLFFLGIQYTSLTNATVLNCTYVVWAPVMAVSMLAEPLRRRGAAAVLSALLGVTLVTRPEFGHIRIGDLIALVSGVMAALAVVQIRRLRRAESSFAIFFYFNLLGVPISLATLLFSHASPVMPALSQLPILLMMGATSVGAQLLMTYGYRALTATEGSLMALTTTVYAALFGVFLFHEHLQSTTLVGACLILFAASAINRRPQS